MSEYDCVGVTSEYLESLKNKIEELEQQKAELIQAIESALNKSTKGGWLHRIFENIIEKYSIKI